MCRSVLDYFTVSQIVLGVRAAVRRLPMLPILSAERIPAIRA